MSWVIEKNKKLKEKKELDKIKKETAEKLKEESKSNLKKAIKNANRDLNEDNLEISKLDVKDKDKDKDKYKNITNMKDDESNISDYESDKLDESDSEANLSEVESEKYFKLKINNDDKIDSELKVQNIDDDPDKLDLDVLDLKTELSDDEGISLDIEELK